MQYAFKTNLCILQIMEKGENIMISKEQIEVAINFLFPGLGPNSTRYRKISKFIRSEFRRLGTCVLWFRNKAFMNLLSSLSLTIDKKEVVVTPRAVLATKSYSQYPRLIFKR